MNRLPATGPFAGLGGTGRLLFVLLLGVLLASQRLAAEEYGSAARVNGVEISLFRLERHFEDYLRERQRNVAAIRHPAVYKRLKREALEQLIDKELLWQEALRRGIQVDAEEVARTRAAVAASFSSPDAFERRLLAAGFDEAAYADYLRREIAAGRAFDQLVETATVSDEEVRRLYEANRAAFATVDEARGLAMVRQLVLEQRTAEARRVALARLRDKAAIEILLPL